jgi:hypothetical protein
MKYFFVLFAFVAVFISCKSKDKQLELTVKNAGVDSANYTTIKWIDSIVNFGSVKNGEKITIKFRCKNTGDKPLVIISAKPGCGCTVADYTKGPILPGSEGLITASFDSKKFSGEVHKYIMINTNTKNGNETTLTFTGTILGGPTGEK